jgi:hypothetical protein
MEEPRTGAGEATWALAMLLVAVGGGVALVGSILGWFRLSLWSSSGFFGRELMGTETFSGTEDWTGVVAMSVGIIVVLLAVVSMIFAEARVRRLVGNAVAVGGILIAAAALMAFLRVGQVTASLDVGSGLAGTREGSAAFGMPISGLGGVLAVLGGFVARRLATSS